MNRSRLVVPLWGKILVRVTAPGFDLTSQRQRVSRLQTEPPGRPAVYICLRTLLSFFEFCYAGGPGATKMALNPKQLCNLCGILPCDSFGFIFF